MNCYKPQREAAEIFAQIHDLDERTCYGDNRPDIGIFLEVCCLPKLPMLTCELDGNVEGEEVVQWMVKQIGPLGVAKAYLAYLREEL